MQQFNIKSVFSGVEPDLLYGKWTGSVSKPVSLGLGNTSHEIDF